mmetsp:Transcript_38610/g.120626  ORF Transcript_38610/g.120626 Transcript_38610/m.120626 type:complete len:206 (-) Transcript_38610:164-781(-)
MPRSGRRKQATCSPRWAERRRSSGRCATAAGVLTPCWGGGPRPRTSTQLGRRVSLHLRRRPRCPPARRCQHTSRRGPAGPLAPAATARRAVPGRPAAARRTPAGPQAPRARLVRRPVVTAGHQRAAGPTAAAARAPPTAPPATRTMLVAAALVPERSPARRPQRRPLRWLTRAHRLVPLLRDQSLGIELACMHARVCVWSRLCRV